MESSAFTAQDQSGSWSHLLQQRGVLPGSYKSPEDHGEHGEFDGRREAFPEEETSKFSLAGQQKNPSALIPSYFSRSPSNTMVRKILNLLRTVNMGRLGHKRDSDIQPVHSTAAKMEDGAQTSSNLSLCVPNSPEI